VTRTLDLRIKSYRLVVLLGVRVLATTSFPTPALGELIDLSPLAPIPSRDSGNDLANNGLTQAPLITVPDGRVRRCMIGQPCEGERLGQ
jgi:hypothetical protein